MHIDLRDLTWSKMKAAWADPFPRVVAVGLVFLLLGLVYQVYVYSTALVGVTAGDTDAVVDVDMRVVAGQWIWDPDVVEVPTGATVHMTIENEDPFAHGFAINELGLDQRLPGSQTTEFTFVANLPPGEYEFFCSIFCGAGHFGQRGTLVITESDQPVTDLASDTPIHDTDDLPVRSRADAIDELPFTEGHDGVKEFTMTIDEILWDYGDGNPIRSYGYNAQLPGPDIRVTEGDKVRIHVTNNLPEATTVHWHGIDIEWAADGVPGVTQSPIQPGASFTYEFTAHPAGTRFYHTHGSHHGDEAKQMDMGLAGAFIVEPAGNEMDLPDQDITWVLSERIQNGIFPIHGAIYPEVPPITVREGERIRVRMINAGSSTFHPMHLHGHQFRVVAVDGNPVPGDVQLTRNTQPILPGETYDIEFIADNPGIWVFHCHELQHAAGGMIAVVQYEGFEDETDGRSSEHAH